MNKLLRKNAPTPSKTPTEPLPSAGQPRLSDPTGVRESKVKPEQMKGYYGITPNKQEWTTIASQLKKKNSYFS